MSCYSNCKVANVENVIDKKENKEEKVLEKSKDIISTKNTQSIEIFKGIFEDNIEKERELSYETEEEISFNYINELDNIMYTNYEVKVLNANGDVILSNLDKIVTKISLDKSRILQVLGEEGKIEVYDENNNLLKEINKEVETNDKGIIEIECTEKVKTFNFKISNPIVEGKISAKVERKIIFAGEYSKEEASSVDNICYTTQITSNKKEIVKNELIGQTIEGENTEIPQETRFRREYS